jgi:hypothetical protein
VWNHHVTVAAPVAVELRNRFEREVVRVHRPSVLTLRPTVPNQLSKPGLTPQKQPGDGQPRKHEDLYDQFDCWHFCERRVEVGAEAGSEYDVNPAPKGPASEVVSHVEYLRRTHGIP